MVAPEHAWTGLSRPPWLKALTVTYTWSLCPGPGPPTRPKERTWSLTPSNASTHSKGYRREERSAQRAWKGKTPGVVCDVELRPEDVMSNHSVYSSLSFHITDPHMESSSGHALWGGAEHLNFTLLQELPFHTPTLPACQGAPSPACLNVLPCKAPKRQ